MLTELAQEDEFRGPPVTITLKKEGAGLGFSLQGGKDSPLGDRPLVAKKIFTGEVQWCLAGVMIQSQMLAGLVSRLSYFVQNPQRIKCSRDCEIFTCLFFKLYFSCHVVPLVLKIAS